MGAKILLVDDSEELRILLTDRLVAEGFEVLQAEDGLKGLEVAQQTHPDLVILDLMMPHMTGEQVWTQMRRDPELKATPVIILTAKRQYQDKFFGKSMPTEDYFSKPYKPDALVRRIREKLAARPVV